MKSALRKSHVVSAIVVLLINIAVLKLLLSAILTIHVNNKSFYLWHAINPFIYPIVFGIALYVASKKLKRLDHNISYCVFKWFWLTLSIECLFCFVILEIYYIEQCPVNDGASKITQWDIFKNNIDILNEMNMNFTIFAGTLLFVLRNSDIPPWDTDTDILVEVDFNQRHFLDNFKIQYISKSTQYDIKHYPNRGLVQISDSISKTLGDIWLFENREGILINEDYTIKVQNIQKSLLFPAEIVVWKNTLVPIPKHAHLLSKMEFGPNYMTPYYNRLQCLESVVVNFRVTRVRFIVWLLFWILYHMLMICVFISRSNCTRIIRKQNEFFYGVKGSY